MLKRYSIVTLFIFAYTIVLAHSIIPHHHHHNHHDMEQSSHHHDDHHPDEDDDNGLAHEFANYKHSSNTTDVYQQPDLQLDHSTIAVIYIATPFNLILKIIETTPPVVRFSNDCIPLVLLCISSKGLRAPPISLV